MARDDEKLKRFLTTYQELLRDRNYEELYKRANSENLSQVLTEFLLTRAGRNPLEYMKKISDDMFRGLLLNELTIPANIEGGTINDFVAGTVVVEAPVYGSLKIQFDSCNINKLILQDGIKAIPSRFAVHCTCNIVKLPASVTKIEKDAFSEDVSIIATPKREGSNRLIITRSEIDFYKKRLRWLRGNSMEKVEEPDE